MDLIDHVLVAVDSCASWKTARGVGRSAEEWLEMWFLGTPIADIPRDNLVEFYAWAFFTREPAELDRENRDALESIIMKSERQFNWKFQPGYNPQVKAIRTNFDPIKVWYHPLAYYVCIWTLQYGSRQYMRVLGFTHNYGNGGVPYFHKGPPERPGVLIENGIAAPRIKQTPVVFVHGLGPGISPYLRFFRRLAASHECFVIELLDISQAGVEKSVAFEDMANALAAMLQAHGHTQACFVGHSFGTFVLSWVSRWRPDIVAKAIFLDPVCFLLSQPDVAFNVLYRQPRNLFTTLAANTVFWELFTANSLHRNFIWYNNVLWLDELPRNAMIALSGMDDIANAAAVKCLIEEHQQSKGSFDELTLLWFDGFFHGEIFLHKSAELQIMDFI
jgi:pimeloyl-ACP methyl ester carboxylesterase